MTKNIAVLVLLIVSLFGNANAESYRDAAKRVVLAVGRVGFVWPTDARYLALHKEISDDFTNTPPLDQFQVEERWIIATTSEPVALSGFFKARSKTEQNLKLGDIVELKISNQRSVKSYNELSMVTKVLCRTGSAEYEECKKANPVTWFGIDGKVIEQPYR